ncbi:D-serine ammonia-lyase [Lentibacillus juripiscarius]|uniref:Probable D-serine dehydratase n=1 Tax=Lentibacillus juripiscarius TaxID=257446 RepID=A0ABW5V458_9BACI
MGFSQAQINDWQIRYPILNDVMDLKPVFWTNPRLKKVEDLSDLQLSRKDIEEAEARWKRFAPFLATVFPETKATDGIIESPLKEMSRLQASVFPKVSGNFYVKCDHKLPIAGSIKARGGIYEVLKHAETLAMEAGMLQENDHYAVLAEDRFREFFSRYSIGVGSTGNLGLSIGIINAKLGFQVNVYMSADAKQWKKDLLRENGAQVLEFSGDFGEAITAGRKKTNADPNGYFVDDEDSRDLFLGYSVAALRLRKQLQEKNITVDADHPLFVYLPCGVGGSPGGITFGLKMVFGDHVHCFFAEPVHSPSVLIGLVTGKMDEISVQDLGIDNRTEADGLAVGRPSRFATAISDQLVSGIYTMKDDALYRLLAAMADREGMFLEPSATAGLAGPQRAFPYINNHISTSNQTTHIAWATGGALVPAKDMEMFYNKGKSLE